MLIFSEDAVSSPNRVSGALGIRKFSVTDPSLKHIAPDIANSCQFLWIRFATKVDDHTLRRFPNLRLVVSSTTGKSHVDIEALKRKGIQFLHLGDVTSLIRDVTSTPELTWFMIQASQFAKMNFSDSKRVQLKVGQELWHREISLSNQTLGIVGLGRVGTRVATYATAFGMQVVYYDPLIGNSHNVYRKLESIEELFLKSDIVSINASLNIDNVELVSAPLFSEFTKRLTLVNSARAELVNESDVLSALDAGRLRKYFSDVYQGDSIASEPGPLSIAFDSGAYGERLQLTPHVGGYSTDSWIKVENVLIDRLKPILVASL